MRVILILESNDKSWDLVLLDFRWILKDDFMGLIESCLTHFLKSIKENWSAKVSLTISAVFSALRALDKKAATLSLCWTDLKNCLDFFLAWVSVKSQK